MPTEARFAGQRLGGSWPYQDQEGKGSQCTKLVQIADEVMDTDTHSFPSHIIGIPKTIQQSVPPPFFLSRAFEMGNIFQTEDSKKGELPSWKSTWQWLSNLDVRELCPVPEKLLSLKSLWDRIPNRMRFRGQLIGCDLIAHLCSLPSQFELTSTV